MSRDDLLNSKFANVINGRCQGIEALLTEYQKYLIVNNKYYANRNARSILARNGNGYSELAESITETLTDDYVEIVDVTDSAYEQLSQYLEANHDNSIRYGCIIAYLMYSCIMPRIMDKIKLADDIRPVVEKYYSDLNNSLEELASKIKDKIVSKWEFTKDCEFIKYPYTMATAGANHISDDGTRKVYLQLIAAGVIEADLKEVWNDIKADILKYRATYAIIYNPNSKNNKKDIYKNLLNSTRYSFGLNTLRSLTPSISKNLVHILGSNINAYIIRN